MKKILILTFLLTITPQITWAYSSKFTIFSGDKKASFFAVASGICKVFNHHYAKDGYECRAFESKGSEENLYSLAASEADFGIIKTPEFNKFFVKNFSEFENKIEIIAKIHDEYLSILVPKNSQIKSLDNLKGKVVNIGSIGSTSALITQKYFSDFNIQTKKTVNLAASQSFKMMCDKKIDAWVYFIGHPNSGFHEALEKCNLELISISSAEAQNFLKIAPFLKSGVISKSL